ncbi:HWE histidine kinase domain-containing protein [Rhizosaccharibacter radicis]|uniref:histidine kinase n=1 Tax=Rhizosaccharibacter radicis TaxID=2782605 RepID=A0ABT1VUA4_9PROT|nr:PAS domain-containing protein [Acetobacteraceae bacterium KSS12]
MNRTDPSDLFSRLVLRSLSHPLPAVAQYTLATVAIVLVGAFRALLVPDSLPWLLFIPVILGVSLVTGRRAGLLAAAVATAAGVATIGDPGNPTWLTAPQGTGAVLFFLVMIAFVSLTASLRQTMSKARALNVELVQRERYLADREAFLSSVLAASTDCIKVLELDGTLSFMSEGGMLVMDISDFNAVRGCPWPDFMKDKDVPLAQEALAEARQGRSFHFEAQANTFIGTPKHWSVSVSPIRGPDGQVARILSVSRDQTAMVEAREQQRLLNNELGHRLKNVLSLVQSIAYQTLRDAGSLEEASAAFSSRLASLGRATDILTATAWQTAELHAVLESGLAAASALKERISVEGPRLILEAQAALALTLAVHELTTNAIKYGSLSVDAGTLAIRWAATDDGRFTFLWKEQGGPPVQPPTRQGFGSRMIERSLRAYFQGMTELVYDPAGIEFRIDAPLPAVARSGRV